MELQDLKSHGEELALKMAYYTAANTATILGEGGALGWVNLGEGHLWDDVVVLGNFVRSYPSTHPETLFRFAASRGIHAGDPTAFNTSIVGFAWRAAYAAFAESLPIYDRIIQGEIAALTVADFSTSEPPPLAAALSIAIEDTILETHGTIFDVSPNMRLLATSSVPTMSALDVDDQVDAAGAGAAPEPAADDGVAADQTDAAGAGGQPTN